VVYKRLIGKEGVVVVRDGQGEGLAGLVGGAWRAGDTVPGPLRKSGGGEGIAVGTKYRRLLIGSEEPIDGKVEARRVVNGSYG